MKLIAPDSATSPTAGGAWLRQGRLGRKPGADGSIPPALF